MSYYITNSNAFQPPFEKIFAIPEIPVFGSVGVPKNHIMINNMLMNLLDGQAAQIIGKGFFSFAALGEGRGAYREGKLITTVARIDSQPGKEIAPFCDYTEYDRQVYDSLCTLWEAKAEFFTIPMVYRTMTGNPNVRLFSTQKEAVTASLEKQRRLYAQIDARQEFAARKVNAPAQMVGHLLDLESLPVCVNGVTTDGYHFHSEPLLLTYAKATKQLRTVASTVLDVTTVSNTEARIALKGYLLRRIEGIKYDLKKAQARKSFQPHEYFNRIVFEKLWTETGQSTVKQYEANNRKYVFQCLDYWREIGYIVGYQKITKKRAIYAVDIII